MLALRMPTISSVRKEREKSPTEAVWAQLLQGLEDMQLPSPEPNNLILASLPMDHFRVRCLSTGCPPCWFARVEHLYTASCESTQLCLSLTLRYCAD